MHIAGRGSLVRQLRILPSPFSPRGHETLSEIRSDNLQMNAIDKCKKQHRNSKQTRKPLTTWFGNS
jgi:hypothetical protein